MFLFCTLSVQVIVDSAPKRNLRTWSCNRKNQSDCIPDDPDESSTESGDSPAEFEEYRLDPNATGLKRDEKPKISKTVILQTMSDGRIRKKACLNDPKSQKECKWEYIEGTDRKELKDTDSKYYLYDHSLYDDGVESYSPFHEKKQLHGYHEYNSHENHDFTTAFYIILFLAITVTHYHTGVYSNLLYVLMTF